MNKIDDMIEMLKMIKEDGEFPTHVCIQALAACMALMKLRLYLNGFNPDDLRS